MLRNFLKQNRVEIMTLLGLVAVFLVFRLARLDLVPIFVDEAIYLRWAQIAKNDAAWRFISLTDGKQPFFVWLTMLAMKLIRDPLLAGRTVSVFAGLATMVGLWLLARELFKNRLVSFMAAILYFTIPLYFLHDRMALMDSLVGAFSVWSLLIAVRLVRNPRLDLAMILGFFLGGGVLTKSSGFLTIYTLPLTLLLFDFKSKQRFSNLLRWVFLFLVAALLSQLFYSVLRLSPFFHIIGDKNALFVYPFSEWIHRPFVNLVSNFRGLTSWLFGYLTWPVMALAVFAVVVFGKQFREKLLLFAWFLLPFTALTFFGNVLFPRFILFMTLPLLVLAAWTLEKIASRFPRWLFVLGLVLILIKPVWADFCLLTDPPRSPLPERDLGQYIVSWTVGYGVKPIVSLLRQESRSQKIYVGTEGNFGMLPASLELYLWENPNIEIKGYWPVDKFPRELAAKAEELPTFYVSNEFQDIPAGAPLELIAAFPCPDPRFAMRLFKVVNQ